MLRWVYEKDGSVDDGADRAWLDEVNFAPSTIPVIVSPPSSAAVAAGATAQFDVVVAGAAPLGYQWRKDEANLPGANASTYTKSNVQVADAGGYSVVVSNGFGMVTSAVARLTIVPSASGGVTASNETSIFIVNNQPTAPYPSTINLAGFQGLISKVTVTLHGISHSYVSDLDVLLVGPNGQTVMLLSDAGDVSDVMDVTITLDDAAADLVPEFSAFGSGVYRPTDYGGGDILAPAAPEGPYGNALMNFNGTSPNGTWSLFVHDDYSEEDAGVVTGGWTLAISTSSAGPSLLPPLFTGDTARIIIQPGGAPYVLADASRIQVFGSSDLINWFPANGSLSISNGNAIFLDNQAGSRTHYFYRVEEN
jgi:subtilisin-like proprotein convertase family protein